MRLDSSDAGVGRGTRLIQWLWASGLLLSALSFAVVFYAASQEPFFALGWTDVIVVFGLGGLLFVSFLVWVAACAHGYLLTRRQTPFASLLLCACISWTGLNLLYLGKAAYGYVQDLRRTMLEFD